MAEGRVPPVQVVEAFDEVEDGHLGFRPGPETPPTDPLPTIRQLMNEALQELSPF